MGIFNFLKRKKDDEFSDSEFDSNFGSDKSFDEGMPGVPRGSLGRKDTSHSQNFGMSESTQSTQQMPQHTPQQPSQSSISFSQQHQQNRRRDFESESLKDKMEVLSSKIDLLKNSLENINQRLDRIENYFMRR